MGWMAWTWPSALFFIVIAVALVVLSVWEVRRPTLLRRGFLRLATTRGDRFFMVLLGAAFIHIGWLAATDMTPAIASAFCVVAGMIVMRWG